MNSTGVTSPVPPPPAPGSPVYCSGPMFSVGDQFEQASIAAALESAGYTTYLPQRDGIEVGKVMQLVNHPLIEGWLADKIMLLVRKWVFALDMFQLLSRCQSLVFNLDGRVPDDGSVVETAAAFTAGKPIVIYKTTPITMLSGADNPMIEGLSGVWAYQADVTHVPGALAQMIAATPKHYSYEAPPHVVALMAEGRVIWDVLESLRGQPTDTEEQRAAWLNALGKALVAQPSAV
jgi:nucleoside 2-deoxyribosyltransferase